MLRKVSAAALALTLTGGIALLAQSGFSDVPGGHPNAVDIDTVRAEGWFGGYPDGTFKPERVITAEQMQRVLERAFDEMTRAEFATFMVGGNERLTASREQPAATTTTTAQNQIYRDTVWKRAGTTCEGTWQAMIAAHEEDYLHFDPEDPGYNYDLHQRLGISYGVTILRVSDWYKRFVTDSFFMCQGEAKFTNGKRHRITTYQLFDDDGDFFWGIYYPFANEPTCSEARSERLTVARYNIIYLYQERRDSDSDRIMCEEVLQDDPTQPVGDVPAGSVAL